MMVRKAYPLLGDVMFWQYWTVFILHTLIESIPLPTKPSDLNFSILSGIRTILAFNKQIILKLL